MANTNNSFENNKLAYIEGWISIILNTFLFALKYWAGAVTGSVALIADAWHTLSDSISSIAVVASTKIVSQPADKELYYRNRRVELIASIIIGVLLAVVAFGFLQDSIIKLIQNEATTFGTLAIVVTVISIITKETMAQFAIRVGKKYNSKTLKAEGIGHRSDAVSSFLILIGIILGKSVWWIDGLLGILVALMLFYAIYKILKNSIAPLIGENPDSNLINRVRTISMREANYNVQLHDILFQRFGDNIELSFCIKLPPTLSLSDSHLIAIRIEKSVKTELSIDATVHTEPAE